MYRTGDPRFRRRLNEIGQTLEHANEETFIFAQTYVKPCFESLTDCFRTCIDASCPTLNLNASQRDRLRRQRGRARAELSFDFYDDWDDEENPALMGWGNDEFDRLLAGSGGYGTISHTQPGRQRAMSYPKGRRKSAVQPHDGGPDPTVIPGSSSLFSRLFGGKVLRYKPSAADLQEHPGARRLDRDLTEGEALLQEGDEAPGKKHRRVRSNTANSGHTTDSLSSRGDIFPSDDEDDAVPLDDEFAMVLERRTTQSGGASGPDTETSSGRTRSTGERGRGKRPSTGSRASTRSSRSRGARNNRSRTNSSAAQTPIDEVSPVAEADEASPTLNELKQDEQRIEREEEAEVERKRQAALKLAAERGLNESTVEDLSSKEATPRSQTPTLEPPATVDEPSQIPQPTAPGKEEENPLAYPQKNADDGDETI